MKWVALCAVLGVALAGGCKRHAPQANASAAAVASGSDAPPSPRGTSLPAETPAPVVVNNNDNSAATLDQLTQELRRYVIRTRSVPKNFEDFAAKSQLQAPPAPTGKKYAIQGQEVVLVKR